MTSNEKRARLEALERHAREAQAKLASVYSRLGTEGPHPELEEALDQARSARDNARDRGGTLDCRGARPAGAARSAQIRRPV